MDCDFAPFDADGRTRLDCTLVLPNTQPLRVTAGQARRAIKSFMESGHSTHSGMGGTLWVLLVWCQTHKMPYKLTAVPCTGYYLERQKGLT